MKVLTDFSVGSRAFGMARGFNPSSLFAQGESGAWFDPSHPGTLFSDTAASLPLAGVGSAVARIGDRSGNGFDAAQAVAAARPIYAIVPQTGRRNILVKTEDFTDWSWAFLGNGSEECNVQTVAAPDSTMTAARLTFTASSQSFRQLLSGAGDYTGSMHVRGTPGETISLRIPGSGLNLVHTLSGEWDRIERTIEADTLTNFNVNTFGTVTARIVDIWRPQVEAGTVATSYQRVGSQYDVTETGVRSLPYLYRDGVDDALAATLPDLGESATLAYASDQGVTILAGQTIAAGAYDVLRDEKLFGLVLIDRALDGLETTNLQAYFDKLVGEIT